MCRDCGDYYDEQGRFWSRSEQERAARAAEGDYWKAQDAALDDVEWGMKRRGAL